MDADHGDVVMFTAVKWLSGTTCLKQFHEILPEITMFAKEKKGISQLDNEARITDLVSMIDNSHHFSSINSIPEGINKFCAIYIALQLSLLKNFVFGRRS